MENMFNVSNSIRPNIRFNLSKLTVLDSLIISILLTILIIPYLYILRLRVRVKIVPFTPIEN